ncbi:Bug family tripartite tricarboxylate transporter substrate binding protein [Bordetella genomosp. 9]|uniref:LacI family transcriptional regulator n=1 Tax=Bordetella genomosp. 9 TaxID=1416803 RepID=A0A1W6Z0Y6_9BORD|nr:tripartite tricarboxylate transporter substrate binding protein [Bordetella genomosp. 9]ARP86854.1 LacI family transcriptional regulator [Bordetella genomosp. 9]ARP90840.1 LacI family transcriptional regulator [Bordetella genomosp. 9]
MRACSALSKLIRGLGVAAALVATAAPGLAHAASDYPSKPIRIVVPYAPGGAVDIVTRLVAQKMGESLKQSIIVDNRPGGATNIGMDLVARAPADGYTLLTASNSLASNGALFTKLNFDPSKDLLPVGAIGYAPLVVVVSSSSQFKTLQNLIDYGKANPDKLTYASAGNGSSGHLASELLKDEGKFNALHVPYKGGAPAITDLLGGRIDFMSINPVEAIPHIKADKMRPLAVMDSKPAAMLPNVPTVSSLGLGGAAASVWWGFCAPKGTPDDVVAKLNEALNQALADENVKTRLSELGAVATPGSTADFTKFVQDETAKWSRVIKNANIKAD